MNGVTTPGNRIYAPKARNERFWIELNSINRNSGRDSENGAILCALLLPVTQKPLRNRNTEYPIANASAARAVFDISGAHSPFELVSRNFR